MRVIQILFILSFITFSRLEDQKETHDFQAEVSRMMDIIINSLYTDKEVFLRELISNAADALDKIRFQSIQEPHILGDQQELQIKVSYDDKLNTLTIEDSGIGMTKQDLIQNLGTLAKSGTTNFIEHIKSGNMNLIGQFGVGFYSAFLVANNVQVFSKHTDDLSYLWESSAANSFTISQDDTHPLRGTTVVLHLKQEAQEFANEKNLKSMIQRYSEFITFPIYLQVTKQVTKEVPAEEDPSESISIESNDPEEQKDIDEAKKKANTKQVTENVIEFEQQNLQKPIWLRDKTEIKLEEYQGFFKGVFHEYNDFQAMSHFRGEGEVEFNSLLFVPQKQSYDYFHRYHEQALNIKLYVRRILIQDKFEDLTPKYLNFVVGIIDSDDLPLNVNREGLQELKLMKVIGKKITKKILDMIVDLSKDDEKYDSFWEEYGRSMKFGLMDDKLNRDKLTKLVKFYSTHNTSKLASFDQYIQRMKEGQDEIYYLAGQSIKELKTSPIIQSLIENNFEVLLLIDPIDEFSLQEVTSYEGKKLINVSKGEFKIKKTDDDKKQEKQLRKHYNPLTEWWQKLRNGQFQEVMISNRLTSDPCLVVGVEGGNSANQERIRKAQAHGDSKAAPSRMILEINPSHPVIKKLLNLVKQDSENNQASETANLLSDTALVVSGFGVDNKLEFSQRLYDVIRERVGVIKDEQPEKVLLEQTEQEDDTEQLKPKSSNEFGEFKQLDDIDFSEETSQLNDLNEGSNDKLDLQEAGDQNYQDVIDEL